MSRSVGLPRPCEVIFGYYLISGGGDIAFAMHTTVRENTDGRNPSDWARNRRSDDYELLCGDGTRQDVDNWQKCNMGEVPTNAILTAGEFVAEKFIGLRIRVFYRV